MNKVRLVYILLALAIHTAACKGPEHTGQPSSQNAAGGKSDIASPTSGNLPLTVTFRDDELTDFGQFPPVVEFGDGNSMPMTFVPHPCLHGTCPGYYTASHVYTAAGNFTAVIRDGRKLPCPSCAQIFAQTTITVTAAND